MHGVRQAMDRANRTVRLVVFNALLTELLTVTCVNVSQSECLSL